MRPLAYTVSRAGCPPGKGTTPAKLLVIGATRPGTAAVLSSGGECSPVEQKNVMGSLGLAPALPTHPWASGGLSPEAGAMGVAGSPLRLTAPICWIWQGEKATPGLR